MNITFLGGGNEIGASSAIVEIGAGRVLIDCGIRMTGDDRLPDLAAIKNTSSFNHLDAVLLTHAHTDHTGALPVLHTHFPTVPVYCTAPTQSLVEVLLRDSLNIQRHRQEEERELPMFAAGAVASLLERIIPVPFGSHVEIGRSGLVATWSPAGHILGAGAITLEGVDHGRTARVIFSGDISVTDQLTVPGMLAPRQESKGRPDVLVIEATYGDRLHSARALEERRLIELVAGVIERRGKILIPAFAVGRAQEVLLMLLREFRAKRLKSFPVYVDGMVRSVCGVYRQHPAHQTAYARRLIEKQGDPFFGVVDEIRAVAAPSERDAIIAGQPCAIVASSGMLTGGASAYYAQGLVGDERHAIALTGYQDEESPGRQLMELAEGKVGQITVAGRTLDVRAQASKYALSAHADANEIAGLVESINPRHVVLVHGEGSARPALAELLRRGGGRYRPVLLPRTGETLSFGATRRVVYPQHRVHVGYGGGAELNAEGLQRLADEMRRQGEEKRAFSEIDLLDSWYGQGSWEEEQYTALVRLLDETEAFRRHSARPHLYRLPRPKSEGEIAEAAAPAMFYAEPNELLHRIESALPPDAGLYRKGYDLSKHEVRLWFHFPLVARERFGEQLRQLLDGTGWTYSINEQPHHARLAEVARALWPESLHPFLRPPALHLELGEHGEVHLDATVDIAPDERQAAATKFKETTGLTLRVVGPNAAPASSTTAGEATETDAEEKFTTAPVEINRAYWLIDEAFREAPEAHRPHRKSLKNDRTGHYIELAFLTPQVGYRQQALLTSTARVIGRALRVKPEPNQMALLEIATRMIPAAWQLQKQPSVHKAEATVRVKCACAPAETDETWRAVSMQFTELTGYRFERG